MTTFPSDWLMFDEAGNLAVTTMMQELKQLTLKNPLPEVRRQLQEKMKQVSKKHGEVYDTDVRQQIAHYLTQWACEVHELDPCFCFDSAYWDLF